MSVLRFVVVSLLAYALTVAFPWAVLAGPAWLGWLLAPAVGLSPLAQPVLERAVIVYGPIRLEDPYVQAGIPLFLGLWAAPSRRSIVRAVVGVLVLEVVAGATLALVALSVARGWTGTPEREPLELVALAFVAGIRILPVPLWMALDPSWKGLLRGRRSA